MKIIGTMIDTEHAGEGSDHDEEYSHYTGGDNGDHYSSSHYTEKEPESSSYSESYSSGDGDDGSYEKHSSYSSEGGEEGEDHY